MASSQPRSFGKYQVESELGRGGFGRVYKAFDPTVARQVAIKILDRIDDPEISRRFQTEAKATGTLQHPNIVTVFDFGEQDGSPYLVMEYLEGQDLQKIIHNKSPLTLLRKIEIMRQVALGLECAHQNGIVHRDVKPGNIRVSPGGSVKVMDFGIARLAHANAGDRTIEGAIIGTVRYMAPEQLKGEAASVLTDIFAYGIVFYELLAGEHPFKSPDYGSAILRITTEEPAPLLDCPPDLQQIVTRALAKDCALRYQSLRDLLLDLEPVISELRVQQAASLVQQAVDLGGAAETSDLLNEALRLDPSNRQARQLRGQLAESSRTGALGRQIEQLAGRAESLIAQRSFQEAAATLEEALRLDPSLPELQARLVESRRLLQLSSEAAKLVSEAAPFRDSGDLTAARERIQEALRLDPENPRAQDLLSTLEPASAQTGDTAQLLAAAANLRNAGDLTAARERIREALQLDPANPQAQDLLRHLESARATSSRQQSIAVIVEKVRTVLAAGDLPQANSLLEAGATEYPAEPVLTQLLDEVRRQREQARSRIDEPVDRTVIISAKPQDLPPEPSDSVIEPPRDVTRYFGPEPTEPLSAQLTILSCPDSFREGQTVAIRLPRFTIGRIDCDLSIPEDRTLSRQHASILSNDFGFTIRDLGSRNGTYLNGRRIPPNTGEPLLLNTEIRLSNSTRLRFRCEISELPDFTGQLLANRYKLEECLRAGRKSALYRASDTRPIRQVAVKLLSPTLANYPGYLDQFKREAQMAAELSHPHICKIYEHGCEPLRFATGDVKRVHYLCMQMLDGGSLASRLDSADATPATVADWLDTIAYALHDAHRNGVVHAGLKPTSIVFSAAGVAYVTDFAIAVRPSDASRTQPVLGAPEYLAPEQWDGLEAGPASDQYSLACLCYRMLTGAVPFKDQIDPQTRSRNYEEGPVPAHVLALRQRRHPVPPAVSAVLARALSPGPADRFPAIDEFARAFRQSLADVPIPERKTRVFVSYRREADAGWAAFFAHKLSDTHGLDVFVDRHRVDSARQVPEKIETAIRESDFFVCLLARSTLESAWVREEIRIAQAAGKPMIPVIHEGFRRPVVSALPGWLQRILRRPSASALPQPVQHLLDAEEVRLFADYDEGAVEKLAKMILSKPKGS